MKARLLPLVRKWDSHTYESRDFRGPSGVGVFVGRAGLAVLARAERQANWLVKVDGAGVLCTRCSRYLRDCPSCGDFACWCTLYWIDKVKPRDRKSMPYQHYDKDYLPIMRDPFQFIRKDEEEEDDDE